MCIMFYNIYLVIAQYWLIQRYELTLKLDNNNEVFLGYTHWFYKSDIGFRFNCVVLNT